MRFRTPLAALMTLGLAAGCTGGTTSSTTGGDQASSSSGSTSSSGGVSASQASSAQPASSRGTSSSTTVSGSGGMSGSAGTSMAGTSTAGSSGGASASSGTGTSGTSSTASSGPVLSSAKAITKFQIDAVDGVITGTNILVTLPASTDLAHLTPTLTITGVSVSPASNVEQDFSQPVTYTVKAEDLTTQPYLVTVQRLPVRADTGAIIQLTTGPGAGAMVDIPAGALGMDTAITVENGTDLAGIDGDALGPPIKFGPSGTQFSVPVQVTVPFSGANAGPDQSLAVLKRNDDTQEITSLEIVARNTNSLTALTSSFSTMQVVAVNNPVIHAFQADTTLLPSLGGVVTLTWTAAKTVRQSLALSPNPGVLLPMLTGASTTATVRLPANPTASPVRHTITLTAVGGVGTQNVSPSVVITVGGNVNDIYTKVVSGWAHWLALRNDGQVVSWGSNGSFEATVPQDLSGVVDIAAHASNSLALKADGTVVMWGESNGGTYVVPAGLTDVTAISLGETHALAVKQDGTVVSWFSDNSRGQADVPAGLAGVVAVAAGSIHSLALKADGTVVGWGTDTAPMGGTISGPMALTGVTSIAAGRVGSLAITADGQAHYFGYVGNGAYPAPTADRLQDAVDVDANFYTRCVLKRDGSVVAWTNFADPTFAAPAGSLGWVDVAAGANYCVGIKADGSLDAIAKPSVQLPFLAMGIKDAVQVSVSQQSYLTENLVRSHTVVLRRDGTVTGWLNVGDLTTVGCPMLGVPAGLTNVTQVSAGGAHGLALKADGTVTAWGCGEATNVPMDLANVTSVAAGGDFSMALKQDGSVVMWGSTIGDAILGATSYPPPTGAFVTPKPPAEPLTGIKAIAAGANAALALKMDGTVLAWGLLGVGPVAPPPGLSNVKAISISGLNAIALKEDGTVAVWGRTYGSGGADPAFLTNVQAVAAGSSSNQADGTHPFGASRWFALLADGTVTGEGSTRWLQTEGARGYRGVVQLSSGENTSAAVLFDGTVKSWGYMVIGGQSRPPPLPPDVDRDGYSPPVDCNDMNADANPGVTQDMAGNMVDENCDGVDGLDADRDRHASVASGGDDCDDSDAATNPGAPELCGDTKDNDCVGGDVACVGTGWAGVANMNFARRMHTSTVLASGKVLIVGDAPVTRAPQVGFAEVYDPADGSFGLSDLMAQARDSHAMVQLQDGRVMVVGGKGPGLSAVASVEIYDPATNTWTAGAALNCQTINSDCSNPASPFVGRYLHTATLLNNGRVLVVGGFNNGVFSVSEVWNPATSAWTPAASLAQGRTRHTATKLSDGRVLIAGGWDEFSTARVAQVEIYGPLMNTFTTVAPLPVPVQDAAAVRLMDGRVVLFGGTEANVSTGFGRASSAVQIYDPTANAWTASQNLARPEANPQATLLNDGTVLVTGSDRSVSLWIPSLGPNGAFVQQRPMGTARKFHNAVRLANGNVLVTGGMDAASGANFDSAEILDAP